MPGLQLQGADEFKAGRPLAAQSCRSSTNTPAHTSTHPHTHTHKHTHTHTQTHRHTHTHRHIHTFTGLPTACPTNLLGVLIDAHDTAPADPQQPWHQLVPPFQFLLDQEEGHSVGWHGPTHLDVAELGVEFTQGVVFAVLLGGGKGQSGK